MLEILLGQILEAVYFALFMIFTKRLDKKRGLFTTLMVIEYLLLLNVSPFSTWSHILYFAISYIILKILYKERSQITDIFTMGIASIIVIIVSSICYAIFNLTIKNIMICNITAKIILFFILSPINSDLCERSRTLIILPIIPQSALLFNPIYEKNGSNSKRVAPVTTPSNQSSILSEKSPLIT